MPSESPIKAANNWSSNSHLILDIKTLGYLSAHDHVLDPTYGKGNWWKKFRPDCLVTHDLATDGVDFRELPYGDGVFDAVAYDPPYVSTGGRETSTLEGFGERYGLVNAPLSPAELQLMINEGLAEMFRVVKPSGIVLTKCQDYVSSGRLWLGTHWTLTHALSLGFECIDRLEHVGPTRAQPGNRKQVHARRNLSTMFVFRKPASRKRRSKNA